jgi:hypothetical protein
MPTVTRLGLDGRAKGLGQSLWRARWVSPDLLGGSGLRFNIGHRRQTVWLKMYLRLPARQPITVCCVGERSWVQIPPRRFLINPLGSFLLGEILLAAGQPAA